MIVIVLGPAGAPGHVGQVAIKYGPLVYCLESNDLPEGVRLSDVALSFTATAGITARRETIAGASLLTLHLDALGRQDAKWTGDQLYREVGPRAPRTIQVKAVPYFAWGNRGDTEMSVWMPAR